MNANRKLLPVQGSMLFVVLVMVAVAEITGASRQLQGIVRQNSSPVQVFAQELVQIGAQPFEFIQYYWHQSEKDLALEREQASLQAQLTELERLKTENQELRAQLGITVVDQKQRKIATPILSFPYRLIKIGSQAGAKSGDLVLVSGTLVGRLGAVDPDYSRVVLLGDHDASAIIGITNLGQRGIIRGLDRQLVLTEVPQTATINPGDRVMTAGEIGIKPGIFVGTIGSEITLATDAVKTFVIEQVNSFDGATLVEVQ